MKRPTNINDIIQEVHDYYINFSTNEIFLHANLKEEVENLDFKTATHFIKNLSLLDKKDSSVTIHLLSGGGEVDSAFAIYDSIKNALADTTVICHGYCMSMATIILQAANHRISMPNCLFMIHGISQVLDGTHKNNKAWIEASDRIQQKMLDIYADKMQNSEYCRSISRAKTLIRNKLNTKDDWILTAEEALKYNLIDGILENGVIRTQSI